MPYCDRCGEEIEFRYVGGVLRPLHVNGSCSESSRSMTETVRSRYDRVESYLDPNASCPVCGARVYFYRSPHNGRVFFDYVGWPRPKHPCTDRYAGRDEDIKPARTGSF